MPNGNSGISASGSTGTQIGSASTALARNVISGNLSDGIYFSNETNNTVQGNLIGLNAAGTGRAR